MIKNKWFRRLAPSVLIVIWLGIAGWGGPIFGKISQVTTNSQAAFLPSSAESTKVQELQQKYEKGQAIPAIVLVESESAFSPSDFVSFKSVANQLSKVEGVQTPVIGPIPSEDGKAFEFIVPISDSDNVKEVVTDLRNSVQQDLPANSKAYVTGPAGLTADLSKAFGGIDGILLVVALTAVFVILLFVYRSVLLPILVLINAVFALCASILIVYLLAKNGAIELNGQSQGILSILVIGAATDYSLLLVSRYREAFEKTQNKWEAIKQGLKGSFEPILASAVTVIIALLCLLFSDLNSNRSLGPIAATGIAFSLIATLTFLPALLVVFGKAAFWPSKVKQQLSRKTQSIKTGKEELSGVWKQAGRLILARPRFVWIITVIVLAICSLGLLQLKANGVSQTDLVLSQSDSADGQKAISRHYDAGSAAPTLIAIPRDALGTTLDVLKTNNNVGAVTVYSTQGRSANISSAKVIDGNVLLSVTLKEDPYSLEAESAVKALRTELTSKVSGAKVGGTTAIALDTSDTAMSDLFKIVPIILLMIFIILAILLRSLIAPLLLIATVVLSFAATMGISALVFNNVFDFPGADATVPLFGFVFLVALGVDYNIFLITRTREEALKYGTRAAILHSLGKTGGVITSAGIVLAATFAALGIIPILFLAQLAFIVAFGVLLDTLVVRSLLVPALFYDIDNKVWWPSKKIK
jgi:RND superfamily putative drug exporter